MWSFAIPGGGGSAREVKKTTLLFWGQKWPKNTLKFYIFQKNANPGGGGSEGGLAKDQTFSGFSFVQPSLMQFKQLKVDILHCTGEAYESFSFKPKTISWTRFHCFGI